jgi:outer membrane murein-binding lipoprotein Lpp
VQNDLGVGAISSIFTLERGVWTLVALGVVALIRTWPLILARINERERDGVAEKAGDWDRLRQEVSRLADRVAALERKVDECEEERDAALRRAVTAETELIKLEAYHFGVGEGKQTAQVILSAERKKDEGRK